MQRCAVGSEVAFAGFVSIFATGVVSAAGVAVGYLPIESGAVRGLCASFVALSFLLLFMNQGALGAVVETVAQTAAIGIG